MGKRMSGRPIPFPPYDLEYDDSDIDNEIVLPSDDDPSIWSVITNQNRQLIRMHSANDRLITRLLALGVNDTEVFVEEDAQDEQND